MVLMHERSQKEFFYVFFTYFHRKVRSSDSRCDKFEYDPHNKYDPHLTNDYTSSIRVAFWLLLNLELKIHAMH